MANKPVTLDHHHFGVDPRDKGFDLRRARAAHADVMRRFDDPKEGDDFKALMLHAIQNATAEQIEAHRGEIQRLLDRVGAKHSQKLAKAIVRAYVGASVQAAREFGKDSEFEHLHPRGAGGQFGHKSRAMAAAMARGGRETLANGRPGQMQLAQAARIIEAASPFSVRGQDVEFRIADKKGHIRTARGAKPGQLPKLKHGERVLDLKGAGLSGEHLTMGEGIFNLAQALGAPPRGAQRTGQFGQVGMDLHREWNAKADSPYGGEHNQGFQRIKAGSQALNVLASGSPKAQAAVAIGRFVGYHGPEAEKVLGPHARKSAYKYRGMQRTPTDLPGQQRGQDYHDTLVARISRHIPTRGIHDLNLASGYTAPSHGYLLDQEGKVKLESHGYGDDHFLPFKLSGLHQLRNGSYIRTRSTGGPTTEDIYAAGISGAKSFTVTSRQGTYVVGFDKDFSHDKRFGDVALGMSKRYGKLLDAVASGKVKAHGEVKDSQYHAWIAQAMDDPQFANSPDRERLAVAQADKKREAQESDEGRTLSLNGEGYDYALRALASQYPYYLHYEAMSAKDRSTGYFYPHDERFQETDESGGHLARVGNSGERDSGYVKPRHLKSANALVGYYDPSIAGRPKRLEGVDTGIGGKLRGDVAHYQNWRYNPYNPANQRQQSTTAPTGGGTSGASTRAQSQMSGHTAQNATQQGNSLLNGPGNGRSDLLTGLNPEQTDLLAKARTYRKYKHENQVEGEPPSPDLMQWGHPNDGQRAFEEAWAENPNRVRDKINGKYEKIEPHLGLTNQPTGAYADEHPDKSKLEITDRAEFNELSGRLESKRAQELRNHMNKAAVILAEQALAGHPSEQEKEDWFGVVPSNHEIGWGLYHYVPEDAGGPEAVLSLAFPTTSPTHVADRAEAKAMINDEYDMEDLAPGWRPAYYARTHGGAEETVSPQVSEAVEAHKLGGPGAEGDARRAAQIARMRGIHHALLLAVNREEPERGSEGYQQWKSKHDAIYDQNEDWQAATKDDIEDAQRDFERLLERYPDLGEMTLQGRNSSGAAVTFPVKQFSLRHQQNLGKRVSKAVVGPSRQQWRVRRSVA